MTGVNPFALVQLYLSYLSNAAPFDYAPGAIISFTGSLLNVPVAGCNYAHTFNDPVPAIPDSLPWILISTPGCNAVDKITITDSSNNYNFLLDDLTVIVPAV